MEVERVEGDGVVVRDVEGYVVLIEYLAVVAKEVSGQFEVVWCGGGDGGKKRVYGAASGEVER